jgi:hypothetical protein
MKEAAGGAVEGAAEGVAEGVAQAASQYGEPLSEALGIYTWFAANILSSSPLLACRYEFQRVSSTHNGKNRRPFCPLRLCGGP